MDELDPSGEKQVHQPQQTNGTADSSVPQRFEINGQPVDRESLFPEERVQWTRALDKKERFP
jgi:hypothetical protein